MLNFAIFFHPMSKKLCLIANPEWNEACNFSWPRQTEKCPTASWLASKRATRSVQTSGSIPKQLFIFCQIPKLTSIATSNSTAESKTNFPQICWINARFWSSNRNFRRRRNEIPTRNIVVSQLQSDQGIVANMYRTTYRSQQYRSPTSCKMGIFFIQAFSCVILTQLMDHCLRDARNGYDPAELHAATGCGR